MQPIEKARLAAKISNPQRRVFALITSNNGMSGRKKTQNGTTSGSAATAWPTRREEVGITSQMTGWSNFATAAVLLTVSQDICLLLSIQLRPQGLKNLLSGFLVHGGNLK